MPRHAAKVTSRRLRKRKSGAQKMRGGLQTGGQVNEYCSFLLMRQKEQKKYD
jgi:hypothetical protein